MRGKEMRQVFLVLALSTIALLAPPLRGSMLWQVALLELWLQGQGL